MVVIARRQLGNFLPSPQVLEVGPDCEELLEEVLETREARGQESKGEDWFLPTPRRKKVRVWRPVLPQTGLTWK